MSRTGRKVLVTGGEGFIASALLPLLRARGDEVLTPAIDVRQMDRLETPVDLVVHLAGISKADGEGAMPLFDTNICGTSAVMLYCRRHRAACVLASSSAVYRIPQLETRLDEGAPTDPIRPYGVSKLLAERVAMQMAQAFDTPLTVLRIFNPYGANQSPSFLVPQLVDAFSRGQEIRIETPGAVRDFVHVSDVARALIAACDRIEGTTALYNVGTGQGHSIWQVGERLAQLMGVSHRMSMGECPPPADWVVADPRRIAGELGWSPRVGLDEGMGELVSQLVRTGER